MKKLNISLDRFKKLDAHHIFAAIALVFGLIFVFMTPLLWGADETTHFGRAYQISQAQWTPLTVLASTSVRGNSYGGYIPQNASKLIGYANHNLEAGAKSTKVPGINWVGNRKPFGYYSNLPLDNHKKVLYDFPNTAPYSPVAYLPSAIGLKIAEIFKFSLGWAIHTARLFDLLTYIGLIYIGLRALKKYRSKWIIFSVALLPMALYQASIITADTITNALAIVMIALFLKSLCGGKLDKLETVTMYGSVLLLPVVKPTYLLLSLLVLLIPAENLSLGSRKIKNVVKALALVIGMALFASWTSVTSNLTNAPRILLPQSWWSQVNPHQQLHYVLGHPLSVVKDFFRTTILNDGIWFQQLFGWLGFDYVNVPALAIVGSFSALVLSIFGAERIKASKKLNWSLVSILIASIAVLFGTFYLTLSPVGWLQIEGIQGRYFIPLLPIFMIIVALIFKPRITENKSFYKSTTVAIVSLTVFSLIVSTIKYLYFTWG